MRSCTARVRCACAWCAHPQYSTPAQNSFPSLPGSASSEPSTFSCSRAATPRHPYRCYAMAFLRSLWATDPARLRVPARLTRKRQRVGCATIHRRTRRPTRRTAAPAAAATVCGVRQQQRQYQQQSSRSCLAAAAYSFCSSRGSSSKAAKQQSNAAALQHSSIAA